MHGCDLLNVPGDVPYVHNHKILYVSGNFGFLFTRVKLIVFEPQILSTRIERIERVLSNNKVTLWFSVRNMWLAKNRFSFGFGNNSKLKILTS